MINDLPLTANVDANINIAANAKTVPVFNKIKTVSDMLGFLETKGCNHNEYHHYTDLESVIKMIDSGYFHLTRGDSTAMNDQHEWQEKGSHETWKRTYIGCFAFGESENMAMWGLYSLPWEDAVRISIPRKAMTNWINNTHNIYSVSFHNGTCERNLLPAQAVVKLSDIVYINGKRYSDSSKLFWNDKSLALSDTPELIGIDQRADMTGFIKNDAWRYENEVRVHIQLENKVSTDKIAIKLSGDIIPSMTITAGPYFSGDLLQRIKEKIPQIVHEKQTNQSGFKHLVNYKTLCGMCMHNEFQRKAR